jgi:hypothetical protein
LTVILCKFSARLGTSKYEVQVLLLVVEYYFLLYDTSTSTVLVPYRKGYVFVRKSVTDILSKAQILSGPKQHGNNLEIQVQFLVLKNQNLFTGTKSDNELTLSLLRDVEQYLFSKRTFLIFVKRNRKPGIMQIQFSALKFTTCFLILIFP